MMEWKEYKLGEILTIKYGKDHKQLADGDIPIYGSGGIMRYGERSLYEGPSILIPRKGSLNNIMFSDKPFWTVDTMFWTIINEEIGNPLFVYYSICKKDFASLNVGSAVPSLTVPVIEDVDILLPSKSTQDKIVSILKSLDDKIEVNRKINENLEQQAQALFKSWFVDFEPFKNGEFVESELGMIPKGWRVYCLSEFLPVITGKKDANVAKGGSYPFFSCSQDFGWTDDYSFEGNAILVAGNGDFNVKTYNGKFEAYQRTYVLIPHNPQYTSWLFYAVKYHLNDITSAARGSVIKFITKGNLADFKFPAPQGLDKAEIIEKFDCFRRIIASNEQQSRRLAELRDTLLPKLMSGELKVNEIENSL